MKIAVAIILAMLFLGEPLLAQRLPRARSRITTVDAELAAEATETLKTKVKAKPEPKAAPAASPSTINATTPSPSSDAPPPSPSPSPSPATPTNPTASPSTKSSGDGSNSTREAPKPSSTTTLEPQSSSATPAALSSVAPPVSSVQVRMAFSPAALAGQATKKVQEERTAKAVAADEETKNEGASPKPKKASDTQESTKKPAPVTSSPTTTSTSKPTTLKLPTTKATSTSKPDQDEEVRDALKKIHQEVLKQPRSQEAKNKSSDSTAITKKPTKEPARPPAPAPAESAGLETAETTYARPTAIHILEDADPSRLDAQASIQNAKFVLRDTGLQNLPSFVRGKDRLRSSNTPNTVRQFLLQKQPLIIQQQQQQQHQQQQQQQHQHQQQQQQQHQHQQQLQKQSLISQQPPQLQKQALITQQPPHIPHQRQSSRSQQLADPIDEEAIGVTTSTTPYPVIPIVHFDKEQSADGSYKTSYETANNIFAEETGFLKNPGVEDQEALVQQGSYSYTAPDGSLISVTYTADEMGFRAEGTHLPTPPPVPAEIQRSLDIIYAQIQRDEEEAAREAELERQVEASETHEERLDPPTTGSKRESRRYLP